MSDDFLILLLYFFKMKIFGQLHVLQHLKNLILEWLFDFQNFFKFLFKLGQAQLQIVYKTPHFLFKFFRLDLASFVQGFDMLFVKFYNFMLETFFLFDRVLNFLFVEIYFFLQNSFEFFDFFNL